MRERWNTGRSRSLEEGLNLEKGVLEEKTAELSFHRGSRQTGGRSKLKV